MGIADEEAIDETAPIDWTVENEDVDNGDEVRRPDEEEVTRIEPVETVEHIVLTIETDTEVAEEVEHKKFKHPWRCSSRVGVLAVDK